MNILRKSFLIFLFYSYLPLIAQVGIGSNNPMAILDVVASDTSQPQITDGILIPRIQKLPAVNPTAQQQALLVYLTATYGTYTPGFYYWDNPTTTWVKISTTTDVNVNWGLLGNANSDTKSFIGTTTPNILQFKVNNTPSGIINHDTPYNTSFGYSALSKNSTGTHNSAMGYLSLAFNTTGYWNTATGTNSLSKNRIGYNNTATGTDALFNNTEGYWNTATGTNSLSKNTTGHNNTATGTDALFSNTVGLWNIANGGSALRSNTIGRGNTSIGFESLYSNTTGYWNTASGNDALYKNTIGSKNTAFGNAALQNNITGSNNTAIGADSGPDSSLNNTTSIGFEAKAVTNNMVRIGNNAVTVIQGNVAWSTPSDKRIKNNVKEDVPGIAFITALRPVTYNIDSNAKKNIENNTNKATPVSDFDKIKQTGFIAQEVELAAQKIGYSFDGVIKPSTNKELYSLSYATFVVPLVKAVQEQQKEIETLKAENTRLKDIEARLTRIENAIK